MRLNIEPEIDLPDDLSDSDDSEQVCQCCKQDPVFPGKDYCAACWVEIDFPDPSSDTF